MPRRNVCDRPSNPGWLYCEYRPSASHCQMSTTAFATGLHPLLTFTTLSVRTTGVPPRPSRMSLRIRSTSDGYGPTVSVGATAHAAPDVPVGVTEAVGTSLGL